MTFKSKLGLLVIPFLALSFCAVQEADAATLILVPEKKNVGIGEGFFVDVRIDTEGESVNAAQGTISFPVDLLEVTSIDKSGSVFGFWIDEPNFSNDTGVAGFIGGTPKGITGGSLHTLRLTMRARAAGSAELLLSNAAITASDGKGTNVLSRAGGTVVSIGTGETSTIPPTVPEVPVIAPSVTPPPPTSTPAPAPTPTPAPIVRPRAVVRQAVPSAKLPEMPLVSVPFYPDTSQWYNHLGETIALWDVPEDVTGVATALDQNPNTTPTVAEKTLMNGKSFGKIEDGVWYIHVRFRNNKGWGEVAHYKVSLDTTPPASFELSVDSSGSDDPSPRVAFAAFDALSGVSYSAFHIDGREVLRSATTSLVLPPQAPGVHTVLVQVVDRAGNSIEDDVQVEVLPLQTPVIEFVSRSIDQEELLFASGKSTAQSMVEAWITNASGLEFFRATVQTDSSGGWRVTSDHTLAPGTYSFAVMARDDRGAVSYPSKSESFRVRPKTVVSLGGLIDLGWSEIFLMALLVGLVVASLFVWRFVGKRKTREAYRAIAGRDVEKFADMFTENVEELDRIIKDKCGSLPSKTLTELKAYTDRLRTTAQKMKKYLVAEVRKAK